MKKLIVAGVFAGLVAFFAPAGLYAKCFIFVHGHNSSNLTYSQARDYWKKGSSDMAGYIAKDNQFYIVNWDSTKYYWDAAIEVAGKVNNALAGNADPGGNRCLAGESSYVVVAHSMGNTTMDFILGNSRSTDPYYNYGGANFANIGNKVTVMAGVQGAHRGTTAADGICGNSSWWLNAISGVVGFFMGSTCDNGTASLQTADSWQVKTYANSPNANVYLISGYEAIFGSSALLDGEDDGLLSYASVQRQRLRELQHEQHLPQLGETGIERFLQLRSGSRKPRRRPQRCGPRYPQSRNRRLLGFVNQRHDGALFDEQRRTDSLHLVHQTRWRHRLQLIRI